VLKINLTKKVCKKLQGTAAGSASWCTNVGNERGEVLISILTESEGLKGLRPMAKGIIGRFACVSFIMFRYEKARQDHQSSCTQIGTAAILVKFPSVHSCLWNGYTYK